MSMSVKEKSDAVEAVPGDIREQAERLGYELKQKHTVFDMSGYPMPMYPPGKNDPWYVAPTSKDGPYKTPGGANPLDFWVGPFDTEEEAETKGLPQVLRNHARAEQLEGYQVQLGIDHKWRVNTPSRFNVTMEGTSRFGHRTTACVDVAGKCVAGPFVSLSEALDEAERLDQERRERLVASTERKAKRQRQLEQCNIPTAFQGFALDSFSAKTKALEEALEISREYVQGFDFYRKDGQGLVFCGEAGSGKTSLACAVALALAAVGHVARYVPITDILRTWDHNSLMSELRGSEGGSAALLVLDWFGMANEETDQDRADVVDAISARALAGVLETCYAENLPTLLLADCGLARLKLNFGTAQFEKLFENSWRFVQLYRAVLTD